MKLFLAFILLISFASCSKSVELTDKGCWTVTSKVTLIPNNGGQSTTGTTSNNICGKNEVEINDYIKELNKTSHNDLFTVIQETTVKRN